MVYMNLFLWQNLMKLHTWIPRIWLLEFVSFIGFTYFKCKSVTYLWHIFIFEDKH
jgi:hypothetical protein